MGEVEPTNSLEEALRDLLRQGPMRTQKELQDRLHEIGFDVTQSTVSRALRRIGAVRTSDEKGQMAYRKAEVSPPRIRDSLQELVENIAHNDSLVVIHTSPGTASLLARYLDHYRPGGLLGTIAGDDTIFVACGNQAPLETSESIRLFLESL